MDVLTLRCDGMDKNKNIPQKVIKLLIEQKYHSGVIISENNHVQYNLNEFQLLVNYIFYFSFYILFIYHLYINYY